MKLVQAAAEYLDQEALQLKRDITEEKRFGNDYVHIFALKNTFVTDRSYFIRGEKLVLPGISTVLQQLFNPTGKQQIKLRKKLLTLTNNMNQTPPLLPVLAKNQLN